MRFRSTAGKNRFQRRQGCAIRRLVELGLVLAQVSNQSFTCQRDPCEEEPLYARAQPPKGSHFHNG
jgi:hypothetical protein